MEIEISQKYLFYFNYLHILFVKDPGNFPDENPEIMNRDSLFHMKQKKPSKNISG